jgi:hypothetical protein
MHYRRDKLLGSGLIKPDSKIRILAGISLQSRFHGPSHGDDSRPFGGLAQKLWTIAGWSVTKPGLYRLAADSADMPIVTMTRGPVPLESYATRKTRSQILPIVAAAFLTTSPQPVRIASY